MNRKARAGFTIVEILVALGILGASFLAISIQFRAMKKTLDETSRLMAMDSFEQAMGAYLRSKEIVEYSVSKSSNPRLTGCFASKGCTNGQSSEIDIYRSGEVRPITGKNVTYDSSGLPCAKHKHPAKCASFYLRTILQVNCFRGKSCSSPDVVILKAQLRLAENDQPFREFVREMERSVDGKFPGLSIGCRENKHVLRGIGILGDALCVPLNSLKFVDADKNAGSGQLFVTPKDCSKNSKDGQSFVTAILPEGNLKCAPKFW